MLLTVALALALSCGAHAVERRDRAVGCIDVEGVALSVIFIQAGESVLVDAWESR